MHLRLLLVLLALAGIIWFLRWFLNTPAETVTRYIKRSGVILAAGILLYLVASGRLHWPFALIGSLLPFARRLLGLLQFIPLLRRLAAQFNTMKSGGNPRSGQQSHVETRLLRMTLDHDTGRMNGEVLAGPLAGHFLAGLDLPALLTLLDYCRAEDEQSTALLEAYLDKMHGDAWRSGESNESKQSNESFHSEAMDRREALEILGLSPEASRQEIIDAHRRLIQKLHPDRGGSDYLASKLNRAKDVLLG